MMAQAQSAVEEVIPFELMTEVDASKILFDVFISESIKIFQKFGVISKNEKKLSQKESYRTYNESWVMSCWCKDIAECEQ